jgi:hypothetical protein
MQEVASSGPIDGRRGEGIHSFKCKFIDPGEILRGKAHGVTTELLSTRIVFAIAIALTERARKQLFTIPS